VLAMGSSQFSAKLHSDCTTGSTTSPRCAPRHHGISICLWCLRSVDMTTASSDESSLDSFGAQLEAEMLQEAEQEAAAAEHLDAGEVQPKRRRVDAEEQDTVVAAAIPPSGMSTSV